MSTKHPPPKVIIFDWDDTICPSSFVDQWKVETFKELPLHFQNLFNEIGKCAEKCLEAASRYGEVIIITNSDDGWVKFSAERFVPNLLPILPKYRIVSARTRYERFYPGQPLCWKAAAFAHEVNEIFSASMEEAGSSAGMESDVLDTSCESMISTDDSSDGSTSSGDEHENTCTKVFARSSKSRRSREGEDGTNEKTTNGREIISFGDSMEERTAVKIVSGQLSSLPKSVMFITSPTPVQLIGQLTMLTGHMHFVCEHGSSLDLEISPDQAHKCAETFLEQHHDKSLVDAAGPYEVMRQMGTHRIRKPESS